MQRGVVTLTQEAVTELSALLAALQLPELLAGKLQSLVDLSESNPNSVLELSEQDVEQLLDQLMPPSVLRQELVAFLQRLRAE